VIITLISADRNTPPDALACLAASSALLVSDIPFNGPISEVRVARIDGKFVVNPTFADIANADIDIMVGASLDNITMVEGEMKEVPEDDLVEALKFAHEAIKVQCQTQVDLAAAVDKAGAKREYSHEANDADLKEALWNATYPKVYAMAKQGVANKNERKKILDTIKEEFVATIPEDQLAEKKPMIDRYYHEVEYHGIRNATLDTRTRGDGRKLDEIRPIWT